MLKTIRQFFTPPVFPHDEDKTRTARVLYALLANMLAVVTIGALATIFVFVQKTSASIILFFLLALTLVSGALAQRGRVRLASSLFVAGTWAVFTLMLLLIGRIGTSETTFHIALTVIAGILLGRRSAILFASLSSIVGLGLALLENAGYPLIHYFPMPPLTSWVDFILAILWTITPLSLTLQGSAQSLARARNSEKRYATLFNKAPMKYLILRDEGGAPIITDCNAAFIKALGYTREQVVGQSLTRFYTPQLRAAFLEESSFQRAPQNEITTSVERELVAQDGHVIHTLLRVAPEIDGMGQTVGVLAMYLDITERRRAEEALKQSEEKFAKAFQSSPDIIVITSPADGRIIETNDRAQEITGYTRDEIIGKTTIELQMWVDLSQRERYIARLMQDGYVHNLEVKLRFKSGKILDMLLSGELIELQDGKYFLSTIRDVTERKQAEEYLRKSEARMVSAIKAAGLCLYEEDGTERTNRRMTFMDNRMRNLLGIPEDQDYRARDYWIERVHPEDIQNILLPAIARFEDEGENTVSAEYRYLSDKQGMLWFSHAAHAIQRNERGEVLRLVGTVVDITERKQAEKKLLQQFSQLQLLRAIDAEIISSVDLDANLKLIAQKAVEQLQIDAAVILLLNPKTQTLDFAVGEGFHANSLQFSSLKMGEGIAGRAAQERRTIHIPDLQTSDPNPALIQAIRAEGFISYYGIPLIAKDQLLGILEIFDRSSLPADPDWLSFVETLAGQVSISIDSATLFSNLQRSNKELELAYDATLEGWSHAMDLRDKETEGHTQRVTEMVVKLASAMQLSEDEIIQVKRGALLHDIGKMGIPDAILLKPGKLTDEEWIVMRKHPVYAHDLLSRIAYLQPALDIPYCHHEKWDGTGYPRGLKGEQIPLAARLFAIVDVWDALRSDRPYRPGWSEEKVSEYIRSQVGTHFDPKMVDLFFSRLSENAPGPNAPAT